MDSSKRRQSCILAAWYSSFGLTSFTLIAVLSPSRVDIWHLAHWLKPIPLQRLPLWRVEMHCPAHLKGREARKSWEAPDITGRTQI